MLQSFSNYASIMLHCTRLRSITFYKFIKLLLPVPEGKSVSLTTRIFKQLRALIFNVTCQIPDCSIRVYQSFQWRLITGFVFAKC